MQSSVRAWIMPATGDCAPERMLVAVRAMAPVAGNPPNMGEKMVAIPCPINSTFGLWRSLLCGCSLFRRYGERVSAKGTKSPLTAQVRHDEADLILAREVVKGIDTLVLRDEKGNP